MPQPQYGHIHRASEARPRRGYYRQWSWLALALLLGLSTPVGAVVSWRGDGDPNAVSININLQVGAGRFYDNGFWGGRSMIANVEAGHIWNGHEALTDRVAAYVNDPSIQGTTVQYDYHATEVGFVLAGLGPLQTSPDGSSGYYYYQMGMAPAATLVSAAIATSWGANGEFNISSQSFNYAYVTTMKTGVTIPWPGVPGVTFTAPADVINSSWGIDDPGGTAQETMTIDALAYANHQVVAMAAGNHTGSPSPQVVGPAAGYNGIAVGALESDLSNPPYGTLASFSNTSPNDYINPTTSGRPSATGVRPKVDICAPGTNLFLAAYTGITGSNPFGGVDPYPGQNNLYFVDQAGTSFASPIVAGGAALLVDAGKAVFGTAESIDPRVIKAVLLNSASKTPGWTNNSTLVSGVLTTTQGLDYNVGAGALNLDKAYDQYLAGTFVNASIRGTTDVPGLGGGTVEAIGWDYGEVHKSQPNIYRISQLLHQGNSLSATLDWFVSRTFDTQTETASEGVFDELHLEIWKLLLNGDLGSMVAQSITPYNNVQHLYFNLPDDGYYAIQVSWIGNNFDFAGTGTESDIYGLAWTIVPEPGSGLLVVMVCGVLLRRQGRKS